MTTEQVLNQLIAIYPQAGKALVESFDAFISKLKTENLVKEEDPNSEGSPSIPVNNLPKEFQSLEIDVFTDMQDLLFRKEVFERYGFFNENLLFAEDVDLLNRLRENNEKLIVTNDVTLNCSMHSTNLTKNRSDTAQGIIKELKLSLDRRRRDGNVLPHIPLKDL